MTQRHSIEMTQPPRLQLQSLPIEQFASWILMAATETSSPGNCRSTFKVTHCGPGVHSVARAGKLRRLHSSEAWGCVDARDCVEAGIAFSKTSAVRGSIRTTSSIGTTRVPRGRSAIAVASFRRTGEDTLHAEARRHRRMLCISQADLGHVCSSRPSKEHTICESECHIIPISQERALETI